MLNIWQSVLLEVFFLGSLVETITMSSSSIEKSGAAKLQMTKWRHGLAERSANGLVSIDSSGEDNIFWFVPNRISLKISCLGIQRQEFIDFIPVQKIHLKFPELEFIDGKMVCQTLFGTNKKLNTTKELYSWPFPSHLLNIQPLNKYSTIKLYIDIKKHFFQHVIMDSRYNHQVRIRWNYQWSFVIYQTSLANYKYNNAIFRTQIAVPVSETPSDRSELYRPGSDY